MNFSVIATDHFLRSLNRIFKKHKTILADVEKSGGLLSESPVYGTSSGNNLYKIRLAISNSGKGKSGGARVITYVKVTESTVYIAAIYLKLELSSIDEQQILQLLKQDDLL